MNQDINDEIIIGYINKTLSKSDRISFEKEIETNRHLADRYEFLKNVSTATQLEAEAKFEKVVLGEKEKLKEDGFFLIDKKAAAASPKKTFKLKYVIGLLLLLLLGSLLFINLKYSDAAIAAAAMADERMVNYTTRSDNTTQNSDKVIYQQALKLYKDGDKTNSLTHFNKIEPSSGAYCDAQYANAFIYYQEGNCQHTLRALGQSQKEQCENKDKFGWLALNTKIQCFGYQEAYVEEFIKTSPSKYYLKKAKMLEEKAQAPLRRFVF